MVRADYILSSTKWASLERVDSVGRLVVSSPTSQISCRHAPSRRPEQFSGITPAPSEVPGSVCGGQVSSEREFVERVIREIATEFPARRAGSDQERMAQERLRKKLDALGVANRFHTFRWNESLYATMALHFGIGVGATVIAPAHPWLAAFLHLGVGVSYWADASRTEHLLRRCLPSKRSQNLVATIPARAERKLRIVLLAHCDAAFTGWVFHPSVVKRAGAGRSGETQPYHARSLELATDAEFASGLLAVLRATLGLTGGLIRSIELLLAVPSLLTALLNLQVVARNETVPGAADNLSGVAALLALIPRWKSEPLADHVELVFAFTGSEEAGTGGAHRLWEDERENWSTDDTIVIGVDTVTNGDLRWFVEGEMSVVPVTPWLEQCLKETASSDSAFRDVRPFRIPVGATDAMPFVAHGYTGVTIGCIDTDYGAPRHYHRPTDTPDNVDYARVVQGIDFVDRLMREVIATRT